MKFRFLMISLLVLMLGGLPGCGVNLWQWHYGNNPDHINQRKIIPIYADSTFTKVERASLEGAVRDWNKVFNGQIVLQFEKNWTGDAEGEAKLKEANTTGLGWIIARFRSDSENLAGVSDATLAFAAAGRLMVVIYDRVGTRDLKTIMMHEMGHLLGAGHLRSNSLMFYANTNNQYNCIDKLTVSEVAAVQGLKLSSLNYCSTPGFE